MSFGITASSYTTTTTTYPDLVLASSPLVYWRLGESSGTVASDLSGNNRDGTYVNGPDFGRNNLVIEDPSRSIYFVHVNDEAVTLADAAWMDVSEMTITCVYMHEASSNSRQSFVSRSAELTSDWSWDLYKDNNVVHFKFQGSGGQTVDIDSGFTVEGGQTYYIAAYAGPSGSGLRIYDHTGLVSSTTDAGYTVGASTRAFVAASNDMLVPDGLTSYLQDVAFFCAALPTATIDALATKAIGPQPKWINRSAGSLPRNGTVNHTLTYPAATAGSLMVAVVAGAVTHTAVTGGWTKQLSALADTELAVFTHTASGGETSFQISHNSSNYPIVCAVYEFPAGSTYYAGVKDDAGNTLPLTGLPGTPVTVFTADCQSSVNPGDTISAEWGYTYIEDIDTLEPGGVTDGVYLTAGYRPHVLETSVNPCTDGFFSSVWQDSGSIGARTSVAFAIQTP